MVKKRVGIITLPGNFNYGNRLQCYAMAETVKRAGGEPVSLERERLYPFYRRAYYSIKTVLKQVTRHGQVQNAEKMRTPERVAAFRRFGERIPTSILPGNGFAAANHYDAFLVGSDQVWNPYGICHQERWYFAKFARHGQRFAVAASLGIDDFADITQAKRVGKGVKGFSRVSVREKRGAELLRQCCDVDAEVICDPTLVLTAEDWRSIADGRYTPEGQYVFTYLLGGEGAEAFEIIDAVTDHGRLPVIPLSDRQKPNEPDAGPSEFIDLIDHASHVVTDSFHAAVFSCILQSPLTIVHRKNCASMFSRLEQLSQMLGIEEKIYGTSSFDIKHAGNYEGVPTAINRERDKFMNYLKSCLDA